MEADIWSMLPDPKRGEKGFEGTIEELVMGYYTGHHVLEVNWNKGPDGVWRPRSTKPVPPRFYNYPYDGPGGDRLMLDRTGGMGAHTALEDFPEHRFLVAVNGGHSGHPAIAAPLRSLTGYWLAAVYGLKWLLQFAQICGVPIRWTETSGPRGSRAPGCRRHAPDHAQPRPDRSGGKRGRRTGGKIPRGTRQPADSRIAGARNRRKNRA